MLELTKRNDKKIKINPLCVAWVEPVEKISDNSGIWEKCRTIIMFSNMMIIEVQEDWKVIEKEVDKFIKK